MQEISTATEMTEDGKLLIHVKTSSGSWVLLGVRSPCSPVFTLVFEDFSK